MTYVIFRHLLVGLTTLTIAGASLWVASRRSRVASRLGMRGWKRQRALLDPVWAAVEPLVRWMGVRVSGILSDKSHAKFDLALTHAGDFKGLTAEEYFGLSVLLSVVLATAAAFAAYVDRRCIFLVPTLAAVGGMIPHLMIDNVRAQRFCDINRSLPYAIDLMALAMSAGLDFPGAVQQVVSKAKANEALRDELGYMLQQFQLGRTRAQALHELARRVPIQSVREFVNALLQAEERGSPVANALEIQAGAARVHRANLAENAASDMRGKMVLPTMMIVGVSMMLVAVPSAMMIERMAGGLR
jgi:tight adherence protein C